MLCVDLGAQGASNEGRSIRGRGRCWGGWRMKWEVAKGAGEAIAQGALATPTLPNAHTGTLHFHPDRSARIGWG